MAKLGLTGSGNVVGKTVLKDAKIEGLTRCILAVVKGLEGEKAMGRRVMLILDGLDLVLAASCVDMLTMSDMLADLREVNYFHAIQVLPGRLN